MRRATVLLLLGLSTAVAYAKPVKYDVRDPAQRDLIQVTSDIPLEKVVALSSAVVGWFELDPDKLNDGIKGELQSDVRTFDSGNASRNDFLKDKVWQASEGPALTFIPQRFLHLSRNKLVDGQPVAFRMEGMLKYRGLSKTLSALGKMTLIKQSEASVSHRGPGNFIRVSANFDLDLTQFGFAVTDINKARLSRYLQIESSFLGSDLPWTTLMAPSPSPAPPTK